MSNILKIVAVALAACLAMPSIGFAEMMTKSGSMGMSKSAMMKKNMMMKKKKMMMMKKNGMMNGSGKM